MLQITVYVAINWIIKAKEESMLREWAIFNVKIKIKFYWFILCDQEKIVYMKISEALQTKAMHIEKFEKMAACLSPQCEAFGYQVIHNSSG